MDAHLPILLRLASVGRKWQPFHNTVKGKAPNQNNSNQRTLRQSRSTNHKYTGIQIYHRFEHVMYHKSKYCDTSIITYLS